MLAEMVCVCGWVCSHALSPCPSPTHPTPRSCLAGLPSKCRVLYTQGDFALSRNFLAGITDPSHHHHKKLMVERMEAYLTTDRCRRRTILAHFGEGSLPSGPTMGAEGCGSCDSCCRDPLAVQRAERDFTSEARALLNTVVVSLPLSLCVCVCASTPLQG